MAWLSGITSKVSGKAEELLTKLDENAALAFQNSKKSKKLMEEEHLIDVKTEDVPLSRDVYTPPPPKPAPLKTTIPAVKSSPNLVTSKVDDDDTLMSYLNNSSSPLDNEIIVDEVGETSTNPEKAETDFNHDISILEKENQMLKNEVRTLNNEMSLLLHRTKAAEKETEKLKHDAQESEGHMSRLQADLQGARLQLASDDERLRSLQSENERLAQKSTELVAIEDKSTVVEELKQRLLESQLKEKGIASELASHQERLKNCEEENLRLESSKREVENKCETMLQKYMETKAEFEQYRTRAQRTLNNKEELIAELRKSSSDCTADSLLEMELQQLREERSTLCEESQQMAGRLEVVRGQLAAAERRLELARDESSAAQHALQEALVQEQKRREVAEEDCRSQAEELHSIRDELSRQRVQLTARLKERDSELTRLRSQLSQRPSSPPPVPAELESRLTALTSSLVQKQTAVEVLTSERNALRLQLEKTEYKYREAVNMLNQVQGRMFSVNDTDDAKAQVPSFLVESPFDTGVTRRVKRAYSSLDAVGIRTSVFLRRYPLARIMALCYVVVLHLWVILVLFSYTPDSTFNPNTKTK